MSEAVTVLKRRVGRPSDARFGVIGVDVVAGGSLTWSDGQWAGTPHLAAVQALIAAGAMLEVPGTFGHRVQANGDDPVAVMAIMARVAGDVAFGLREVARKAAQGPATQDEENVPVVVPIQESGFRGDVPMAAIVALAKQTLPSVA